MDKRSSFYFRLQEQPVEKQVKQKIISAGGLVGETPDALTDDSDLTVDLLFDDSKFSLLCFKLKKLVQQIKPSASLSCDDVSACTTVGDVVKLIDTTLSNPNA